MTQNGITAKGSNDDSTTPIHFRFPRHELLILRGHIGEVYSATYSPDSRQIITANSDHTARIWDAITGRELMVLRGHTNFVRSATFNHDGTQILTAGDDAITRIYFQGKDLMALAKRRTTRDLTCDERIRYLHEPTCPTPTPTRTQTLAPTRTPTLTATPKP